MKRLFSTVIIFLGLAVCFTASANNTKNFKIGVVDIHKVINEAPQREALMAEIRSEFSNRREELINLNKEIAKQEEKLQRDNELLSADEKRNLETNIMKRKRNLQRAQQSLKEDLSLSENQKMQSLVNEIGTVVEGLATKEGFDVIFTREAAPFHVSERVDLTEQVIAKLKTLANKGK